MTTPKPPPVRWANSYPGWMRATIEGFDVRVQRDGYSFCYQSSRGVGLHSPQIMQFDESGFATEAEACARAEKMMRRLAKVDTRR